MESMERIKVQSITVDNAAVGRRIKEFRESKGLSQTAFYELVTGISNEKSNTANIVKNWEKGITAIPLQEIARIAAIMGRSIEWLLTGKEKGQEVQFDSYTCSPAPTLRDYCEILFVDMARRFNLKWTITPAPDENGLYSTPPVLSFTLPLAAVPAYYNYNDYEEKADYVGISPDFDIFPYAYIGGYTIAGDLSRDVVKCASGVKQAARLGYEVEEQAIHAIISAVPPVPLTSLSNPFSTLGLADNGGYWDNTAGKVIASMKRIEKQLSHGSTSSGDESETAPKNPKVG